ncbi:MAG: hypothetical protein JNN05_05175 [Candidatus Omnitrophica bacterium]|nr:hypothetical protein [Candidatus Omnitrophota bacterium]
MRDIGDMRTRTLEWIKELCGVRKVLVVAHEAGAARILVSMLARLNLSNVRYILDGPAVKIFEQRLGPLILESLTEGLVGSCDLVVTGTSLVPELERKAIAMARKAGIKSYSIVDHWVNYRQRFIPVGASAKDVIFPDEIWVCDSSALDVAVREGLPEEYVYKIDNYYFHDLRQNSWPVESGRILYICEPVFDDVKLLTGDGNAWGYNEFELVDDFLKSLERMDGLYKKAVLRLHPNESTDKYDAQLKQYKGAVPVEVSSFDIRSIEEECCRAEVIVGVESMALAIGLFFGRPVYSCLPLKSKRKCQLPQQQIKHIHSVAGIGQAARTGQ